MKNKNHLTIITTLIILFSAFATTVGIFSNGGPGPSTITSVRGKEVQLYGKGIYHQMSVEVAPQGIAQDMVTLLIAIPLLGIGLLLYRKGSTHGVILLAGALGYFLITYLFFTMMAMYNQLFLIWIIILSLSFYGFILCFNSLKEEKLLANIQPKFPEKFVGGYLMVTAIAIGFLWLSVVVPPALNGTIPLQVEHYTTLVVQALDLSILLPASFIAGALLIKKKSFGYKLATVYIVFLAVLMTALSLKVITMANLGYAVIPVIYIIPAFNLLAVVATVLSLRNIRDTFSK